MLAANLELYAAQRAMSGWARDRGVRAHDLPRARRRARARRRSREPGDRGAAAGLGRGPVQGDRAGRGGVRPLRDRRARAAASGAAHERGRAGERRAVDAPIRPTRSRREIETMSDASRAHYEELVRRRRVRGVLPARDADRADRHAADRVAPGRARHGRVDGARRPPRDPVGVRVGTEPREPHRAGTGSAPASRRSRRVAAASAAFARWRAAGRSSRRCSRTPSCRSPRPTPRSRSLYLARGDRPDLAAAIRDELARTTELVLAVTGHDPPARRRSPTCSGRSSSATPTSTRCRSCSCASSTSAPDRAHRAAGPGHDQRGGRGPAEHRLSRSGLTGGSFARLSQVRDRCAYTPALL